ncbi:MAG: MoaD/ThiS family protein [Isosphaeraceae bacterium]
MRTVRLFALARQLAGRDEVLLDLPEPATVAALKRALAEHSPPLANLIPNLLISVNAEYARDDQGIPPGAEIAAFPPVSGGSPRSRD